MTITLAPYISVTTPAGATGVVTFGGFPAISALSDTSDSTYVTFDGQYPLTTNVRMVVSHSNPLGVDTQHLDYIQPRIRQAYTSYAGWFYPAMITGYVGGVGHTRQLPNRQAPPEAGGINVNPSTFIEYWWEPSWDAADGTRWSDCSRFDVTWALHVVGTINQNGTYDYIYSTPAFGIYHIASLSYTGLEVAHSPLPLVTNVAPNGGSVTVPQPTASWWTTEAPQSSYQAAFVPVGTVDSKGVVAGAAGFDPDLANLAYTGWNSGKVVSAATAATSTQSLVNGSYRTYVRPWTSSPSIPSVRGSWELGGFWRTMAPFSVAAENVNPPAVTVTADATYYTTLLTVSPGTATAGYQNPTWYEVQYQAPDGTWAPVNIPDGRTKGGTTTQLYDSLLRPGAQVSYRARSQYVRSDGLIAVTAWVTATATVVDKKEWWLRCPGDRTLNRSLSSFATLLVQSWKPTRERPQAVSWGVGARYATVTHDVVKSATMELSVWAFSKTALASLMVLLERDDDVVLVSPWAEVWRVQVGDRISEEAQRASPRLNETTPLGLVRVVTFSLTEVGS